MRDYGPFAVFDGNQKMSVTSSEYYDDRPSDNQIPNVFANQFNLTVDELPIAFEGSV
jgi:hypothetical protein